jgi:hypothetical protein
MYECHVIVWFSCLNPTVISSVTVSVKTYTSSFCLVVFIPSIPTEIPSVYTDDIFPSVFTDGLSNGKNSVGKDHHKIPTKKISRCFSLYSLIFW